jgi:putative ABC transport system permease protein
MNTFFRKLGWLARRRRKESEWREELEFHLDEETQEREAGGFSKEAAARMARRDFGNVLLLQENTRAAWGWTLWGQLAQDLRFGARVFWKSTGYTIVAWLSLALGISATTAMFSVVYGVLVSPYPYARANEIWAPLIRNLKNPQQHGFSMHQMRDYVELKKLPAWSDAMATLPEGRLLTGDHEPENFTAVSVTANAFQFLGVAPILGRSILPSDVKLDGQAEPVIVLTEKAWRRLFNGSPSALGKTLLLNEQPFVVIGVMPSRFGWWTNDGGWLVLPEDPRDQRPVAAIMRLSKGVSPQAAAARLQALHVQLAKERPDDFPKGGFTTVLQNYMNITVASGSMESSLRLLFGAVGFLLLIACANVANLQLARGTARAHEMAVRTSIGAGRGRLVRQLLTESIMLAVVGGVIGVLLAFGITQAIVLLIPASYVPNEARINVNLNVLLFSAVVSVASGVLFGLAPALQSSRPDLGDTMKEAGRTLAGDSGGGRTRQALVVAEIALCVVLLAGAGVTIRGFLELQSLALGFQADRVLVTGLPVSPRRYATYDQRIEFSERVLEAVRDLPGVQAAAIGNGGLPFGGPLSPYSIEGEPPPEKPAIQLGFISADYPRTMGIPLRAGRGLEAEEVAHAVPVALVNESAAKMWPAGRNPIGRRVRIDLLAKPPAGLLAPPHLSPTVTVVGVLGDTRNAGRMNPPQPAVYIPYTMLAPTSRTLALRTQMDPMLQLNAVRQRLHSIDPAQPLARALTVDEIVSSEIVQPRFNVALFSFFGALGLALALVGIYSALSYTVGRRTHEIGVRIALGARPGDVVRLIVTMGGRLVIAGLTAGLILSLGLARVLRNEVIDFPPTDGVTFSAVVVLLSSAALLACWIPARRAGRLDPMSALRHE